MSDGRPAAPSCILRPIASEGESELEIWFPHLVSILTRRWQGVGDIDFCLQELIVNQRGGRKGFPPEVMDELLFLVRIRWHIQQASGFGDIEFRIVYSYTDDNCRRQPNDLDWRG